MAQNSSNNKILFFSFKKIFIVTLFFIFINLTTNFVEAQSTNLEIQDYDNFKKRNLLYMLTICNFNETKCKKLRT